MKLMTLTQVLDELAKLGDVERIDVVGTPMYRLTVKGQLRVQATLKTLTVQEQALAALLISDIRDNKDPASGATAVA